MHILRDMAIFVIFATISKNRKLLSRYRFTPPGDSSLPPTGGCSLPSPRGSSSLLPRGDSCLPPPGWVSDPGVGEFLYKRGTFVSAKRTVQESLDEIYSCSCCIYSRSVAVDFWQLITILMTILTSCLVFVVFVGWTMVGMICLDRWINTICLDKWIN